MNAIHVVTICWKCSGTGYKATTNGKKIVYKLCPICYGQKGLTKETWEILNDTRHLSK